MSARQRTTFYRLSHASSHAVPGTIEMPVHWEPLEQTKEWLHSQDPSAEAKPTAFLLAAWCVTRAAIDHDRFRSVVVDVDTLRRYRHLNLGIAVALPDDELTTAIVEHADTLEFEQFVTTARARIQDARDGADHAAKVIAHVSLTSLAAFGLRTGVP